MRNYNHLSRRQANQLAMVVALQRGDFDKAREFALASKPTRMERLADKVRRLMRCTQGVQPEVRL